MSFDTQLRQGIKVAERLGTWVLYAVRDARNLDHLIGYLIYKIDDFERRRQRKRADAVRAHHSKRISHWRRAVRWVGGLDPTLYAVTAERILDHVEKHPSYRRLPYVAASEVEPGKVGGKAKTMARPTRRAGRPRTRAHAPRAWKICSDCGGIGAVRS